MDTAFITNIQDYSIHDGPGIRTVVFFKGCPLACKWCANPECISGKPQIGFIEMLCKGCGKCVETCPNNAINTEEVKHRIDYSLCDACGKCSDNCSYGALVKYGNPMTVDEVWDEVRRDKIFYDTSGGGVTVSGGEPLLHPDFVRELFKLCHGEQIDTCVETCGCVNSTAVREVIPVTDHFLFDLKHLDSDIHKKYTGQNNEKILKNAAFLIENGADVIFRHPLIPGINDTPENIEATAGFLKKLGKRALRFELMPFHRMGKDKYRALDQECSLEGLEIMDNEKLEKIKKAYIDRGINCTISR
ncbi:MAG: glycyl-radical enzyme activating protein [Desulfobacteraceae bacterium]|jgi:pyruvate formate lyase activating enzyme